MLPIKLPYYPKMNAMQKQTITGVLEIDIPDIYEHAIPGMSKSIYRIDLLSCLEPKVGSECLMFRELLYTVIAGESDKYNPHKMVGSLYRRYKKFTKYVNDLYDYADPTIPMYTRVLLDFFEDINYYRDDISEKMHAMGGKFLVETHGYLYFAFNYPANFTDIVGGKKIC